VIHNIGDGLLLIEAALVDRVFSEVGLDDVQPAEMTAAVAVTADTARLMVMVKVVTAQLTGSPIEVVRLPLAQRMVVPTSLCLHQPRVDRAVQVYLPCVPQLELGLEEGLGGGGVAL
jgi:hypothetical protein